jgi:hypothetical protein
MGRSKVKGWLNLSNHRRKSQRRIRWRLCDASASGRRERRIPPSAEAARACCVRMESSLRGAVGRSGERPSLDGLWRRSNPRERGTPYVPLDCFASLAMSIALQPECNPPQQEYLPSRPEIRRSARPESCGHRRSRVAHDGRHKTSRFDRPWTNRLRRNSGCNTAIHSDLAEIARNSRFCPAGVASPLFHTATPSYAWVEVKLQNHSATHGGLTRRIVAANCRRGR